MPNNGYVIRLSDGAVIPPDPDNTDYKEYLVWVDKGNSPLPADVVVPQTDPLPADEGVA